MAYMRNATDDETTCGASAKNAAAISAADVPSQARPTAKITPQLTRCHSRELSSRPLSLVKSSPHSFNCRK